MNERKIIEDLLATMRLATRHANTLVRAKLRKAILEAEAALAEKPKKEKKPAGSDE